MKTDYPKIGKVNFKSTKKETTSKKVLRAVDAATDPVAAVWWMVAIDALIHAIAAITNS